MNKRSIWILITAVVVSVVLIIVLVSLLWLGLLGIGGYVIFSRARRSAELAAAVETSAARSVQEYASNGETIYFTGVNDRGQQIPFTGGPHWLYTYGGGCALCHGDDGRGGVSLMMLTEIPPDIRYHHLIEEEHGEGKEHPPYTDETIKQAITEGVEPDGEPMDLTMPRWQMSERDLDDLLEFLKTRH